MVAQGCAPRLPSDPGKGLVSPGPQQPAGTKGAASLQCQTNTRFQGCPVRGHRLLLPRLPRGPSQPHGTRIKGSHPLLHTPHRFFQSPEPDTIAPAPGAGLCAEGRLRPCPQAPAVRATEKPPSFTGPALAWANAQACMAAPVPEDNSDSLCQAPQGFDL